MVKSKKRELTTAIEWVLNSDGTKGYAINLWLGCTKISPACDNCYAEISRVSTCLGIKWGDNAPRRKCNPYKKLTAINNKAKVAFNSGELQKKQWNLTDNDLIAKGFIKPPRIRVFINPDSDIFDNEASQEWRDEFFNFVDTTPHIDYILLTKRIGNAKDMLPQSWLDNGYPANVWQLITVCSQEEADRDIPKLLELDVSVRGLSIEPLLGEIDLSNYFNYGINEVVKPFSNPIEYIKVNSINWAIIGGESGKNARPVHPDWARKIRDQCVGANVPFFFKQWGEWGIVDCNKLYADQHNYKAMPALKVSIPENGIFHTYTFCSTEKLKENDKHEVWIYNKSNLSENPILMKKTGKKAAGNLLDGKVWQQMPQIIIDSQ